MQLFNRAQNGMALGLVLTAAVISSPAEAQVSVCGSSSDNIIRMAKGLGGQIDRVNNILIRASFPDHPELQKEYDDTISNLDPDKQFTKPEMQNLAHCIQEMDARALANVKPSNINVSNSSLAQEASRLTPEIASDIVNKYLEVAEQSGINVKIDYKFPDWGQVLYFFDAKNKDLWVPNGSFATLAVAIEDFFKNAAKDQTCRQLNTVFEVSGAVREPNISILYNAAPGVLNAPTCHL